MLNVFRESIGRYIAIAILALIAITFIFFGIDFSITQTSFAAKVNGESIPMAEFDRELTLAQNNFQQLYRDELTDELRVQIRREVIDRMVMREVMIQRAQEAGLRYSDARLAAAIRSDPAFQVNGQFSADVYRSRLTAEGLTPAGFEARQREQAALLELQTGIVDSAFITPAEFRRNIELFYEQRRIAYALFEATAFLDEVEVTDEEIAAYYEENPSRFETEESVDIALLELTLDSVAEDVEVSEDDLLEYYETEVERYAVSEERRVSHILIEVEGEDYMEAEARAAEVLERLEAGEDFAELAAEVSDDVGTRNVGGDLGWISLGMLPGPFEDALFAMEQGAIEGPVETEFGYHILRLDDVRAGDAQPFEVIRDQLRDELAADRAYNEFYDLANELANSAFDAIDNLEPVAEEFGLEIERIERLTRSGVSEGRMDVPQAVVAAAFDPDLIASGENSDLIEISEEEVAVLRVDRHNLPEPRPLEEVTEEIRSLLELEAAQELAAAAANRFRDALDAAAAASGTQDATELAAMHGGTWIEPAWIERGTTSVANNIRQLVYNQPKPASDAPVVMQTPLTSGGEAVVLLLDVEPGVPDNVPVGEREQGQTELADIMANIEMNAYASRALNEASVRVPDQVLEPNF